MNPRVPARRIAKLFCALLLSGALSACDGQINDGTQGGFSVASYPQSVDTPTVELNGTKPSGHGIFVDGVNTVNSDSKSTWRLSLDLELGANTFSLQSGTSPTQLSETITVMITRTSGGDTTAPQVVSTSPAADATGVVLNGQVTVTFSEAIHCATVTNSSLLSSPTITGTLTCTNATVTLTPSADLQSDTTYTMTLLTDVENLAGNALQNVYSWSFTTGSVVDNTPPSNPTLNGTPTSPTTSATVNVSGTREADSSIEAKWSLDGALQHDYQEIIALGASTTWAHDFPLSNGINVYTLRAVDAAGNESCEGSINTGTCTVTFTVDKQDCVSNCSTVNAPVVDSNFPGNTNSDRIVLWGTKDANTGINLDGNLIIPVNGDTTWHTQLTLNNGSNHFDLKAQDSMGNISDNVNVDITYNQQTAVPSAAEIKIELELKDLWKYIGEEWRMDECDVQINRYSLDIWLEGPIDPNEPCIFDHTADERRYTRYAQTLIRGQGCYTGGCDELWLYPNYRPANYLAALIEGGIFNQGPRPLAPDMDRRDPFGNMWDKDGSGGCGPYNYRANGNCDSSILADGSSAIDGLTEASSHPEVDRSNGKVCLNGQNPPCTSDLGDWAGRRVITAALANTLRQGTYLLNIAINLDRSFPAWQAPGGTIKSIGGSSVHNGQSTTAPYQWNQVINLDQETCWDNPAHDTQGMRRVEGLLTLDGSGKVEFWHEKGYPQTVSQPANNPLPGVAVGVSAGAGLIQCDWDGVSGNPYCSSPGTDTYSAAPHCPEPNSAVGQPVTYLNNPPNGETWSAPVRVEYCPNGCP